ncbi:hypothetical protein CDD83_3265 [Cordyceps sp. RAO-2017]|nr:hypothetical protein CDD83_3265 [Cordyceps sp. RAO-2017]
MCKINISRLDIGNGLLPQISTANILRPRGLLDDILNTSSDSTRGGSGGVTPIAQGLADILTGLGNTDNSSLPDTILSALAGRGLNDLREAIVGNVDDRIMPSLGLPQWVSLHAQTICNGNYTNPDDPHSSVRARSCTKPNTRLKNITEVLDLNRNVEDATSLLRLPRAASEMLQLYVDMANGIIIALTTVFSLGTVCGFLTMLLTGVSFILADNRGLAIANLVLAVFAFAFIGGGFVISAIAATVCANRANRVLEDFKVTTELGSKYLQIGIAATVLSFLVAIFWIVAFIVRFRRGAAQSFIVKMRPRRSIEERQPMKLDNE